MGVGHYTASIKYTDGNWYCCNDSIISKMQESEVICEEAYVLFYVRRGFMTFGQSETIKLDDINLTIPIQEPKK